MPRPILEATQTKQQQTGSLLSTTLQRQSNEKMNPMQIDRMLRKNRSKEYMEALHKLDAGGHTHNQKNVDEIIRVIREEFPEIELAGVLLGYVAVCYLGKPYEVHTLDMAGGIVEHYKAGQTLPDGLEKARGIALRGGYEFVEVYADCCRVVSSTGVVSVIKE